MNKTHLLLLFQLLWALLSLGALEEQLILGREQGWNELRHNRTELVEQGFRGFSDIVLQDAAYERDAETDLLLHFDSPRPAPSLLTSADNLPGTIVWEQQPAYTLDPRMVEGENILRRFGSGSALFTTGMSSISARARPGALLYPGTDWRDFTIEFWLYPAETESHQSILHWNGVTLPGEWGTAALAQELSCTLGDTRLSWRFINLFRPQNLEPFSIELQGQHELLPRQWHHHLIRYDSSTGLIEYLVDGRMEDFAYANHDQQESDTVYLPFTGSAGDGILEIGAELSGFLDELRISSANRRELPPAPYQDRHGFVLPDPIDLGFLHSRLVKVESSRRTPSDSDIFFYYQLDDSPRLRYADDPDWIPFTPGAIFPPATRGRFLHLMAALYPDGREENSPVLSDISVTWEPDLPPPPPSGFTAVPGDGSVRLSWNPVPDPDLQGYKIYYGSAPGRYFGTDSEQGSSPVEIGQVGEFELTGLTNGRLYYFSIVAYDSSQTPYQTIFSAEVSARPRRLQSAGNRGQK